MTYNAVGLPTFLDPESRRDVRDWHEACVCKTNDREECGVARSEGLTRTKRQSEVSRSRFFVIMIFKEV